MATKPKTVVTDTGDVVEIEDGPPIYGSTPNWTPGSVSIYQSTEARAQLAEAKDRAAVLVEVIKAQGLAKTFGNSTKPHVYVEGWQFLASQFGLIPDIEWSHELQDYEGARVGWEARAVLRRLADGAEIAHAEAECRWDEANWKGRPSYAVRSMAQTRAVSKVCRIALSSVMVMAGYSATPAEEMADIERDEKARNAPPKAKTPKSPDDPHCPACLDQLGTLVAVSGPHDRKPYWRCTAPAQDCGGYRTHDGKDYSWSGWHHTWENSARDYRGQPIIDDPQEVVIDTEARTNHSAYMVNEIMAITGLPEPEAKMALKVGVEVAVAERLVDGDAAIGGTLGQSLSDGELRVIVTHLTLAEAESVITESVKAAAHFEASK
jgi:hypothetical protein